MKVLEELSKKTLVYCSSTHLRLKASCRGIAKQRKVLTLFCLIFCCEC